MEKSNRGGRGGRSFGGDRGGRSFGGDRGGRGGDRGGRSFGGDRGGRGDRERPEMFDAVCSDCGDECQVPFKPSRGKPVLCSDCFRGSEGGRDDRGGRDRDRGDRRDRRDRDDRGGRRDDKKRYPAVCCECGRDFELPFRPSSDRAVYCSDCFEGKRDENDFPRGGKGAEEEADFAEYFEEKFAELNAKLDAVVRLLTGKTEDLPPVKEKKAKKKVAEVVEEVKEVKAKKEKKAKKAKK
ncbi:MAG: hypothetical protein RBS56_00030 [Candidatus Gracilibacteria bacterium]|nr:hypothetical protein [Candidatus Gracilibacteria bacterium]